MLLPPPWSYHEVQLDISHPKVQESCYLPPLGVPLEERGITTVGWVCCSWEDLWFRCWNGCVARWVLWRLHPLFRYQRQWCYVKKDNAFTSPVITIHLDRSTYSQLRQFTDLFGFYQFSALTASTTAGIRKRTHHMITSSISRQLKLHLKGLGELEFSYVLLLGHESNRRILHESRSFHEEVQLAPAAWMASWLSWSHTRKVFLLSLQLRLSNVEAPSGLLTSRYHFSFLNPSCNHVVWWFFGQSSSPLEFVLSCSC